jgi:hypothetical protein
MRKPVAGIILTACMVALSGSAQAITCDECRDIDRNRVSLERDIAQKESALQTAFDKKKFHEVTEIRKQVLDLRKNLIELQKKDVGCKDACRPDVVKETECIRIRSQIIKLEEDPQAEVEKVDALYRELANCNKDLAQLKKTR